MALAIRLLYMRRIDGDCWRWTGAHTGTGYGYHWFGEGRVKRQITIHRVAHRLWLGPIPDGLHIDHVRTRGCAHRDCFNPAHLEAVTPAENARRGTEATKTHCVHGHEYTPENTILHQRVRGGSQRVCRQCQDLRTERRRAARAAARLDA
jgi:hypothetical protein